MTTNSTSNDGSQLNLSIIGFYTQIVIANLFGVLFYRAVKQNACKVRQVMIVGTNVKRIEMK
ncbi:MAG TPA: hypothetical protein VE130_09015 [Nitrososphaeraceae archaeon]|nr:hypothetical protein [Nitrososphaeraceae archaeon]